MAIKNFLINGKISFEELKKINEFGAEYWSARDLQTLFGYDQWRRFEQAIKRGINSCKQSGNKPRDHFAGAGKMIDLGKGGTRKARSAMQTENLTDDFFKNYLIFIHKTIHHEKNFTKHAMNNALIAIGLRNDELKKLVLNIAKEIGKVEVDYKETNCKTSDATSYILRGKPRYGTC